MDHQEPFSRRDFLRVSSAAIGSASVVGAFDALTARAAKNDARTIGYGPLRPVKDESTGLKLIQLPEGFRYRTFGWTHDQIDDGTRTPSAHDGMAVISMDDEGVVTLCRNHERSSDNGAFGEETIVYDHRAGGGCMNLQFDTRVGEWRSAQPSLGGTVRNCAGGPTPWGTWLSCEETVLGPGSIDDGKKLAYQETHGWIFEVPASGNAVAEPLHDMGRFVHEAVAVDPDSGIVYETEDRGTAGFYRFIPKTPGKLSAGGTLEMLKVPKQADLGGGVNRGATFDCEWVKIDDPRRAHTPGTEDALGVFNQGRQKGGTRFARLEGCWYGNGLIYFVSTSGGRTGSGQIWSYNPQEDQLALVFESPATEVLDSPDNIAVSPRGGMVLCEDGDLVPQRLHGLTPDGQLFSFAANNAVLNGERNGIKGDYRGSEWAGATFSPDGKWLFVNMQSPGITFAITGPWADRGL
ncbi:PhoX family protein [Thalassoroseus pseudoceratinae]|uniref:PhoX family protein n=1 Tax=Thalassoroseus pseudoceratinae TaxID=2713176 RepID=UPI001421EF44|nr:alkaline phosphatase PhoX [Thalassoroseus pseudoceratinae]